MILRELRVPRAKRGKTLSSGFVAEPHAFIPLFISSLRKTPVAGTTFIEDSCSLSAVTRPSSPGGSFRYGNRYPALHFGDAT